MRLDATLAAPAACPCTRSRTASHHPAKSPLTISSTAAGVWTMYLWGFLRVKPLSLYLWWRPAYPATTSRAKRALSRARSAAPGTVHPGCDLRASSTAGYGLAARWTHTRQGRGEGRAAGLRARGLECRG